MPVQIKSLKKKKKASIPDALKVTLGKEAQRQAVALELAMVNLGNKIVAVESLANVIEENRKQLKSIIEFLQENTDLDKKYYKRFDKALGYYD